MQEPANPVFRVSIVAIVLFLVTALFARSMLDAGLRRSGMDPELTHDLSYLVVPPILLVLMFPYLRRCRAPLRRLFEPRRLTLRVVASSVALGLTLRLMWWAQITFLIGIGVIRDDDPHAIAGPVIDWDCPPLPILATSIFIMAVVAPAIEEIVHRGFLLHGMLSCGRRPAIVASAALFALMHVVDAYEAAFFAGIVLAVQALNYRALWGPMLAHATYNAAVVLDWDCFGLVWNPAPSDPVLVNLTWVSVPVMLAGASLIVLLTRQKAAGDGIPSPADSPPR